MTLVSLDFRFDIADNNCKDVTTFKDGRKKYSSTLDKRLFCALQSALQLVRDDTVGLVLKCETSSLTNLC